jgi:hypothetical protein
MGMRGDIGVDIDVGVVMGVGLIELNLRGTRSADSGTRAGAPVSVEVGSGGSLGRTMGLLRTRVLGLMGGGCVVGMVGGSASRGLSLSFYEYIKLSF